MSILIFAGGFVEEFFPRSFLAFFLEFSFRRSFPGSLFLMEVLFRGSFFVFSCMPFPRGLLQEVFHWKSFPGGLFLEFFAGGLHLEVFLQRSLTGSLFLQVFSWSCFLEFCSGVVCRIFFVTKGIFLQFFSSFVFYGDNVSEVSFWRLQ